MGDTSPVGTTEVLTDGDPLMQRLTLVLSGAKTGVDAIAESMSLPGRDRSDSMAAVDAYYGVRERGGRLRILTRVDFRNLARYRELSKIAEIRHLETVSGNLLMSESECLIAPGVVDIFQKSSLVSAIYSNDRRLVQQSRESFERLWHAARPAGEIFRELERGSPKAQTKIVRGEDEVSKLVREFLARAASEPGSHVYSVSDMTSASRTAEMHHGFSPTLNDGLHSVTRRYLTDIQDKNIGAVRKLQASGSEVRHLQGNKIRFSVSKDEYIETTHAKTSGGVPDEVVWSSDPQIVAQATRVFEALWATGTPAESRVQELEEGTPLPMIELIRNSARIKDVFLQLIGQAQTELLVIQPTPDAFRRAADAGMLDAMVRAAIDRGVEISIISPDSAIQYQLRQTGEEIEAKVGKKLLKHRDIPKASGPSSVTVVVADRRSSLVVEQNDAPHLDFTEAMDVATYSTRNSTVLANVRFFERVWEELELREREELALEKERRSRRTAELLQDILSHDIRNYNQIVRTSGELLKETPRDDEEAVLVESILRATDGSTSLIERTKRLGKIMAGDNIELVRVDVRQSLKRSIDLVTRANPDKAIEISLNVEPGTQVTADDLLDEVFTNLISNSVNYTDGPNVRVQVAGEEDVLDGRKERFWKISITDEGRGIPDDMKGRVFTRHVRGASGGGLGMSIVYALMVERFVGKVNVFDRVAGDHTKGTRVELWLPKAR